MLITLVLVMFVGGGMMMGAMMDGASTGMPREAMGGLFVGAGLVALLIVMTIGLAIAMALFYGVPLVMLAGQNA